jgi:serine/threonine protein kinase
MSMIGKTLAHYEITIQLGKGGMGEMYQAKDRKLGRDVAIKVLPEEFARHADWLAKRSPATNHWQCLRIISVMLLCVLVITSTATLAGDLDGDLWRAAAL